uniref:Pentapeptide repeat-containing protein n=1 Tax=Candidatus Kentrum sp. FW TaxID=2126338 RepID=A0A450RT19_9GAMM|nr:MAG: Pentapeptide repeat-containing protein [Candidatus Kentron sp. FW]
MKRFIRFLKKSPRFLYDHSGARHIVEMARLRDINAPGYKKPPTLFLWFLGLYVALYGIASTRYEANLDRVENRMSAVVAQLSTSDEAAFKNLIAQIPGIQKMETPLEPSLLWPLEGHFVLASFFRKEPNPEILQWSKETLEAWKNKLAGVNLARINLSGTNLREANLSEADLWGANLSGADLERADLSGADLNEANLSEAQSLKGNLSRADLGNADLSGVVLEAADLSWAHLWKANLSGAGLFDANLSGAWLKNATLSEANLMVANLADIRDWEAIESMKKANIQGIENAPEGFRAWALEKEAVEMDEKAWLEFLMESSASE